MEDAAAKRKILILLVGSVLVFAAYSLFSVSVEVTHEKGRTYHATAVLYVSLSVYAVYRTDYGKVRRKDVLLGCLYGVLSIFIVMSMPGGHSGFSWESIRGMGLDAVDLVVGGTVVVVYLLCVSLAEPLEGRLTAGLFSVRNGSRFIPVVVGFTLVYWACTGFASPVRIGMLDVLQPISAAVSEEVIFRLFPYLLVLTIGKGKMPSKVLCVLLMTVPHVIVHYFDLVHTMGFIPLLVGAAKVMLLAALPLTLVFFKFGLWTAMAVHFLYDFLQLLFGV